MTATPVPLDQLDAVDAWRPWQPTSDDPWGRKWAAHLYRRAAFGASREELIEAERLGPERTLDLLLQGHPQSAEILETLIDVGRIAASRDDAGDQLRSWWLYCMLQGGHPLREKLTLFWHNHFATSLVKVQDPNLMFRQNCLLRTLALGRFGPLLQDVSRDAAMLLWLDSNSNIKGRPNENYARELMELFSLGVGNYSEKDVREAARAFTGWHTDGERFKFAPSAHDGGSKTVLGQTGAWDGGDVVCIVLEQPAAARFLVRKFYSFFISENAAPPDGLLQPLWDLFRKSGYDIAALVRTMLASRHFYSDHAFRQRIKGPVEYVLGAVRAVYRRYAEGEADFRPLSQELLVCPISAMGQQLFAPPNVKGWPGGRSWLNTSTMLERDNFAAALAMGTLWGNRDSDAVGESRVPSAFDPARECSRSAERGDPGLTRSVRTAVQALVDLYLPGGIPAEAQDSLVAFVAAGNPTGAALDHRVREAVHAILTMAEYQLA
jgi:uncharacterized protein (DUF1800 family)